MSQNPQKLSPSFNQTVRYRKPSPPTNKTKFGIIERYTYKSDSGELLLNASDVSKTSSKSHTSHLPARNLIQTKSPTHISDLRNRNKTKATTPVRTDCDSTTDIDFIHEWKKRRVSDDYNDSNHDSDNEQQLVNPYNSYTLVSRESDSDSDCQIIDVKELPPSSGRKKTCMNEVWMIIAGTNSDLKCNNNKNVIEEVVISDSDDDNEVNSNKNIQINKLTTSSVVDDNASERVDDVSLRESESSVYEITDNIKIVLPKNTDTTTPDNNSVINNNLLYVSPNKNNNNKEENVRKRIEILSDIIVTPNHRSLNKIKVFNINNASTEKVFNSSTTNLRNTLYKLGNNSTLRTENDDLNRIKTSKTIKKINIVDKSDLIFDDEKPTTKTIIKSALHSKETNDECNEKISKKVKFQIVEPSDEEFYPNLRNCLRSRRSNSFEYDTNNTTSLNDGILENSFCSRIENDDKNISDNEYEKRATPIPLSPSKYPRLDATLSPESIKSEFYSYLKINTNPNAQKVESIAQNRRSIRVRNLIKENEKLKHKNEQNSFDFDKETEKESEIKILKTKTKLEFPSIPMTRNNKLDFEVTIKKYFYDEHINFETKSEKQPIRNIKTNNEKYKRRILYNRIFMKQEKFKNKKHSIHLRNKKLVKTKSLIKRNITNRQILRNARLTQLAKPRTQLNKKLLLRNTEKVQDSKPNELPTNNVKYLNPLEKFDLLAKNYMSTNSYELEYGSEDSMHSIVNFESFMQANRDRSDETIINRVKTPPDECLGFELDENIGKIRKNIQNILTNISSDPIIELSDLKTNNESETIQVLKMNERLNVNNKSVDKNYDKVLEKIINKVDQVDLDLEIDDKNKEVNDKDEQADNEDEEVDVEDREVNYEDEEVDIEDIEGNYEEEADNEDEEVDNEDGDIEDDEVDYEDEEIDFEYVEVDNEDVEVDNEDPEVDNEDADVDIENVEVDNEDLGVDNEDSGVGNEDSGVGNAGDKVDNAENKVDNAESKVDNEDREVDKEDRKVDKEDKKVENENRKVDNEDKKFDKKDRRSSKDDKKFDEKELDKEDTNIDSKERNLNNLVINIKNRDVKTSNRNIKLNIKISNRDIKLDKKPTKVNNKKSIKVDIEAVKLNKTQDAEADDDINLSTINTQPVTFVPLDKTIKMKPLHRLLQPSKPRHRYDDVDPLQMTSMFIETTSNEDPNDTFPIEKSNYKKKGTHEIDIDIAYGPVYNAYYIDCTLVIVQEKCISFWKQTPLGNILGAQNMWYTIGRTKRFTFQKGCINMRTAEMVMNVDNSVAYFELWIKEHRSEFRKVPVADIFVTVYYHKGYGSLDKKVIQLINIKGFAKDVRYTVMRYSNEIVVSWRDQSEPTKTIVRCFEIALDFQTLVNTRQMESVYDDDVTSMHNITNCDSLVIGSSASHVYIWNVKHGWLSSTIKFDADSPSINNNLILLHAQCETGYLFLFQQFDTHRIRLVAINGTSGQWKQLQVYHMPPSYERLLGISTESGILMTCFTNGFLCFEMKTGELLVDTETPSHRIILPSGKFLVQIDQHSVIVKHVMLYVLEYENHVRDIAEDAENTSEPDNALESETNQRKNLEEIGEHSRSNVDDSTIIEQSRMILNSIDKGLKHKTPMKKEVQIEDLEPNHSESSSDIEMERLFIEENEVDGASEKTPYWDS